MKFSKQVKHQRSCSAFFYAVWYFVEMLKKYYYTHYKLYEISVQSYALQKNLLHRSCLNKVFLSVSFSTAYSATSTGHIVSTSKHCYCHAYTVCCRLHLIQNMRMLDIVVMHVCATSPFFITQYFFLFFLLK